MKPYLYIALFFCCFFPNQAQTQEDLIQFNPEGISVFERKLVNGEVLFHFRLETGEDASSLKLDQEANVRLDETKWGFSTSFTRASDETPVTLAVYNISLSKDSLRYRASLLLWPDLSQPPEHAARTEAVVIDSSRWISELEHDGHLHRVTLKPNIIRHH